MRSAMTPERWQQIDSLLQMMVEVCPDDRGGQLDQACAGDQTLREEVESLLHFREMARRFLETPAMEEAASLLQVEDQPDLIAGLLVDRYQIEKCLGAGSMGEVYLAEDTWLDRKVAIKFLPPYLQADEVSRKRLVREAKAAAKLDHPNICAVYEVNKADDRSFIVMQYIGGDTLADTIRDRRLSLSRVLDIGIQILEALAEAHSHRIVHRDVKPGNIMLTLQGQVKMLDFGLAKQVGITLPEQGDLKWSGMLSRPGDQAGTPPYMSPEQASGSVVDARSDLFAVGVILYECLTGSLPFSGDTVIEIFEQVVHVDPLPVSSLNSEVPSKLETAISKALAKHPDARYQSAKELLSDLRELRAALPPDDTVSGPTQVLSLTPTRRSFWNTVSRVARQPRYFLLALAVPLIVLFVLSLMYRPPHQPSLEAVRHYEKGTRALRNGAYFEASQALEQAVVADDKYALAHARLAEAYTELDRSDDARHEVFLAKSTARDQRMEKSADLFLQAITSTVARDFAKATAIYQQITAQALAEEKGAAFLDLGRAYEKNGETDQAKKSYQQAAILAPHDGAAFLRLGMLCSREQELDDAQKAFQNAEVAYRVVDNSEGVAEVYFQRGFLLLNLVHLREARIDLENAQKMAEEAANVNQQIRAQFALSSIAVHEGRTDDAESLAIQAIQWAQRNGMEYQATGGLAWVGDAYLNTDKSKAEEYYQKSLELAQSKNGPLNEALALLKLANLRQTQRQTDAMLAYLDKALPFLLRGKYRKWLSQATQLRGRAYRDRGNYDAALALFREQLLRDEEVKDTSQMAHFNVELGHVLIRQEQYDEALEYFGKGRDLFTSRQHTANIPYVVDDQASALWQLGRYSEARAYLDEATAMAERPPVNSQLLASIFLNSALLELSDWNPYQAEKQSRKALKLADKNEPVTLALVQYSLGLAQVRSGRVYAGRRNCEAAVRTATSTGDPELICASTLALSEAMLASGEASLALEMALGLKERLVSLGKQSSEWLAWLIAARASERLGNIAAAREYASQAAHRISSIEQKWSPEVGAGYLARRDIQHFRQQIDQLLKL
ncbi:MAG TPA: protein kinase [Pyrinomonadaceae bacterium]|nr:protein kinase [Pyrinomonadaceae bacterium]